MEESKLPIVSDNALSAPSSDFSIAPPMCDALLPEEQIDEEDDRDSDDDLLNLCQDVRRSAVRAAPLIMAPGRLSNTSLTNGMAGMRSGYSSRRGTDIGDKRVVTPPRTRGRGPTSLPQISGQYVINNETKNMEHASIRMLETIISANATGNETSVESMKGMRELNSKLGDLARNRSGGGLDSIRELRNESEEGCGSLASGKSPSMTPSGRSPRDLSEENFYVDLQMLNNAKRDSGNFFADVEAARSKSSSPFKTPHD